MGRTLLLLSVILSALPNFNLVSGLPLLDVVIFVIILVHAIRSREILIELLLFSCLVLVIFLYRYSFNEIDLLEYWNYVLRFVIFYGMLLIPTKLYSVKWDSAIWGIITAYLIINVTVGLSQILLQGLLRSEIEYFYFNDINILFFTLFLTLYISRNRNILVILLVLILTILSGARLASLIGLYYLFSNVNKRTFALLTIFIFISLLLIPEFSFQKLLLFDRLSAGLTNDEYSRGSLWLVYLNSIFELCTWCSIYQEFTSIGLHIMRPAHNFFLSTIVINGIVIGILVIIRALLKVKSLLNVKHFWFLLILLLFDIQFSRGLFLLLMIYDATRHKEASGVDFGLQ